jgi:hypothetical protein
MYTHCSKKFKFNYVTKKKIFPQHAMELNLSSLASVKTFAINVLEQFPEIHCLVSSDTHQTKCSLVTEFNALAESSCEKRFHVWTCTYYMRRCVYVCMQVILGNFTECNFTKYIQFHRVQFHHVQFMYHLVL